MIELKIKTPKNKSYSGQEEKLYQFTTITISEWDTIRDAKELIKREMKVGGNPWAPKDQYLTVETNKRMNDHENPKEWLEVFPEDYRRLKDIPELGPGCNTLIVRTKKEVEDKAKEIVDRAGRDMLGTYGDLAARCGSTLVNNVGAIGVSVGGAWDGNVCQRQIEMWMDGEHRRWKTKEALKDAPEVVSVAAQTAANLASIGKNTLRGFFGM